MLVERWWIDPDQSASVEDVISINPFALKKAKIVCNFCLSECNRVKFALTAILLICQAYFKT